MIGDIRITSRFLPQARHARPNPALTITTASRRVHHPVRMIPGDLTDHSEDQVAQRMGPMSNGQNRRNGPQFRTVPLIISAAMTGAGTLIALTGLPG
jgi:hypothetical protein